MSEPTTIIWLTLPRNGNGGAALIHWRPSTHDTVDASSTGRELLGYVLGEAPPRYPLPATIRYIEPLCFYCGSINGECNRAPQDCLDNQDRGYDIRELCATSIFD